jgi:hypothetical protein
VGQPLTDLEQQLYLIVPLLFLQVLNSAVQTG